MSAELSRREKKLCQKLSHGDPRAFEKAYQLYIDQIFRFIILRTHDKEITQDISSEVFFKAWRFIKDGQREITNMRAFLFQIARNAITDHFRKSKTAPLSLDEKIQIPTHTDNHISDQVDTGIMYNYVKDGLKTLPAKQQELIILRYMEELSLEEMSNILDMKKNAISVALNRALKALKSQIKWHIDLES